MPRKYNNQPTTVDGIRFASKKEAGRYCELSLMQKAGIISHLQCHPRYRFEVNGLDIGGYTADFCYREDGELIVEDVKGGKATKTEAYGLRKNLMLACHGIEVQEI